MVVCFYCRFYDLSALWILALIPAAAFPVLLSFSWEKWKKALTAFSVLGICFFVGFIGFYSQCNRYDKTTDFGECTFSGRVVEIREYSAGSRVVLDNLKVEGEKQNCKLVTYLPASFVENITLSDELLLRGEVTKREFTAEGFSSSAKDFGKGIYSR